MKTTIVGLGNPGEEYEHTRHNVGRLFVADFAEKIGASDWRLDKKANAHVADGEVGGANVRCVLPDTYMNRSGSAVAPFITSAKAAARLVVVYDDLDKAVGTFKISFGRGSGGHKGVDSIIRAIKTRDFVRVRIGICPATPGGKLKKPSGEGAVLDYLMGNLTKQQTEKLAGIERDVRTALETIATDGYVAAMNRFN